VSDLQAPDGNGGGDTRDFVAGTLRGYRTWRIVPSGVPLEPGVLPLASVTRPHVTWPPQLSASCTPAEFAPLRPLPTRAEPTHRSPARACDCGIYAWYSAPDARTFAAEVFGVVQASGVVMLGTSGFRAEHAQITAVATRNQRVADACADAGIAVYRRRRDLLADYPPDDVSTLIDEEPASSSWHPRAFAMVICFSVWLRAAILIAAAGLLPPVAVIAAVVVSELAVLALVFRHLGRTPKVPRR
jgi:hypothetical protein